MSDKILMIIAPFKFKDIEYLDPKAIFERNDLEVVTASCGVDIAIGADGAKVPIQIDIKDVKAIDYSAIVLIGGGGALSYLDNLDIKRILRDAKENYILISAICIAPTILAHNGFLDGLKATVWDRDNEQIKLLEDNGAIYVDEDVVEDRQVITANGPGAAKLFARKIVNYVLYQ
jgi:4-methyl-5(b-hydroxyethyl)-thiazole monophosphate biosynthesis